MYITGTQFTFEVRLHEFPVNSGELAQYIAEYGNYTNISQDLKTKFNTEHNKKVLSYHNVVSTGKPYV